MSVKTSAVAATFVALSYLAFDASTTRALRQLATDSIHRAITRETSPRDALIANLPEIPTTEDIPAYLTLCQEWIRHDAYYKEDEQQNQRVIKEVDVCMDWSSPHFSLLEIFAALIVSPHVPRIQYRHNCNTGSTSKAADMPFDFTTIQQVLNVPPGTVKLDDNVMSPDDLKQQCKRCLLSYDGQVETSQVKSRAFHHCFAWPEDTSKARFEVAQADQIPYVPYKYPGVAPLSSIIVPVREVLYTAALEWQEKTPPQQKENDTRGVVYWIDPTSIGLYYEDVLAEIPLDTTSISILAGPLCATGARRLPTGEVCNEYGEGLAQYLKDRFAHLPEENVSFSIVTSTAAAYSRMILAPLLICPPRSNSCLLPAVVKRVNVNRAIVLEDPNWMKAIDFMAIAGHHGIATTKLLAADKIPPTLDAEQQQLRGGGNAVTDSEGYPLDVSSLRSSMPSDEEIASLSSQQILDDIAIAVVRFKANTNLLHIRDERVPTVEEVEQALARGEPLLVNHPVKWDANFFQHNNHDPIMSSPTKNEDRFRHVELATDADSGREAPTPSEANLEDSTTRRYESMLRMQNHGWEDSRASLESDVSSKEAWTLVQ